MVAAGAGGGHPPLRARLRRTARSAPNAHRPDVFRNDEPYNPYYGTAGRRWRATGVFAAALTRARCGSSSALRGSTGRTSPPRQTTFFRMVRAGPLPVIAAAGSGAPWCTSTTSSTGCARGARRSRAGTRLLDRGRAAVRGDRDRRDGRACAARPRGSHVKEGALRLPGVAGRVAELGDRCIQAHRPYQQQLHVLGEMDKTIACDISAARRDLGYEPRSTSTRGCGAASGGASSRASSCDGCSPARGHGRSSPADPGTSVHCSCCAWSLRVTTCASST
jgi:hypothetical protein